MFASSSPLLFTLSYAAIPRHGTEIWATGIYMAWYFYSNKNEFPFSQKWLESQVWNCADGVMSGRKKKEISNMETLNAMATREEKNGA